MERNGILLIVWLSKMQGSLYLCMIQNLFNLIIRKEYKNARIAGVFI